MNHLFSGFRSIPNASASHGISGGMRGAIEGAAVPVPGREISKEVYAAIPTPLRIGVPGVVRPYRATATDHRAAARGSAIR
jgi:hypothetical protein